ncbi:putative reverse transcriptase domain-containing protein, partial [Tanacetum coccineum]
EALRVRNAVRNLGPLIGDEGEQEVNGNRGNGNGVNGNGVNGNGGNGNGGNGGNGNRNGNGGEYGYNFRGFMPARECTYQDFLKCQPLNFNGTEGVVRLTHWFEKMETRTIGIEAAYAKRVLSRNEVQNMETELWNLVLKGNDLTTYTRRFQELVLLCTRMVLNEEDKVERFVGGLPDNIQGNVIAAEPSQLQDAIRIANNLMDQKLKGYARSAENKRRVYTAGNNERKGYIRSLPYYNKCKTYHAGPCTVRCRNCKRVVHMTRDYKVTVTPNTQRNPVGNQPGIVCYECGRPGHFRKDCPKLRNQNRGNKTENQTGGNEATARAYVIGGRGTNPDSNVVTGTFLLNNCYASMLFDSGVDRSFVLSTFSAFLDVTPSTLDTSYAVEHADGRISETNVVLKGCMLGLLGHSFDIDLIPVELISFDVIIVRGDDCDGRSKSKLNIISCTKTHKYMQKGCQVYLAQVTSKKNKDKSEEKRLEDVPIVREFLKVFLEDFPRLPPSRQVEYQIDLC